MGLQEELGFPNPIMNHEHETVLNIVLTVEMLAKEGDRMLRAFGLTDSQFNILILLKYQANNKEVNQTQLGRMLLVNRSNVTGLVDRMEQAGWVERKAEPGDRRVKRVRLTRAGSQLLEKAEKVYFDKIKSAMSDIPKETLDTLCNTLEVLRDRVKNV